MSSQWVAPTATAIVGLAGIAATWLTARSGRRDQQALFERQYQEDREAALRDARRNAFVALTGTITSIIWYGTGQTPKIRESFRLQRELSRSLAEVQLMGGEAVRQLAARTSAAALRFLAGAMEECSEERKGELRVEAQGGLSLLQRTMASDLGIPPGSSVEEIKRSLEAVRCVYQMARHADRKNRYKHNRTGDKKLANPDHADSGQD
jgi:hypothetical protein